MKVFVSWSGEPSRSIAHGLGKWLGQVIQAVKPWVSDSEIDSGKRWRTELSSELDETDFGIICLTSANQRAPWLMFEAGALAKKLNDGRVVPLCIGMETTDVDGPLSDFQGRKLDIDGMRRLFLDINSATPDPVSEESVESLFELTWPKFEELVRETLKSEPPPPDPRRSNDAILDETLDRVRRLERTEPAVFVSHRSSDPIADLHRSSIIDLWRIESRRRSRAPLNEADLDRLIKAVAPDLDYNGAEYNNLFRLLRSMERHQSVGMDDRSPREQDDLSGMD